MSVIKKPQRPSVPGIGAHAGDHRRHRGRVKHGFSYLYLLPMVFLVGVFLLYPAAETIWLAFTNANGLNAGRFIGIANFTNLFSDPVFLTSLRNTIFWVIGTLVLQVACGLLLALVLSTMRSGDFFKRLFYLPATISAAATGVIWYFVFDPEQGVLNTLLRVAGMGGWAQHWLTDPPLNTFAMIFAATWQTLGQAMILFLVGLQNIPREPLEAAQVDGAYGFQLFWYVTLPLLRPMTAIVVAISLINSFKVFDIIWVMTQGGPYRSSETLAVTMYRESFINFNVGYGSSVAVVLTVIVLVISVFYLRSMFRRVEV